MWCPALASLVGLLLASPTTPANRTIALESRKLENNTLVCRCGMDTSDPKNKDANSKCAKIQYHKDSKGIDDDFSGVHIVNDSACAIDLLKHPKGVCKKDVYVNTERGLVRIHVRRWFYQFSGQPLQINHNYLGMHNNRRTRRQHPTTLQIT